MYTHNALEKARIATVFWFSLDDIYIEEAYLTLKPSSI